MVRWVGALIAVPLLVTGLGACAFPGEPPSVLPTISVNDASGSQCLDPDPCGATDAVFTVTLSQASTQTVTVSYTTTPGTAFEGYDYNDATGTVTFVPGDVSETVTVDVLSAINACGTFTFSLVLGSPTNATVSDGTGAGTIQAC